MFVSFVEKLRMWDVFVEGNSECVILERRCWSSEGGFLCRLKCLRPRIEWAQLVPKAEMNGFRKWPPQKTVIVSREKGKDEGCKLSCCCVNSIRVKSDDEIIAIGMSSKNRAPVTTGFIINGFRLAMS